MAETLDVVVEVEKRVEIDTTAPFGSVKEAVNRFGGLGFWKPGGRDKGSESVEAHDAVDIDIARVEQQAAELEKELIMKEKDTFDVLKELESTKMVLEELKLKLQHEESAAQPNLTETYSDEHEAANAEDAPQERKANVEEKPHELGVKSSLMCPSAAPGLVLLELKQAKLNLARTTSDLADIGVSVESYNKKIERERMALEKTRERLSSNSSKVASLEQELNRTRSKLESARDNGVRDGKSNGKDVSAELKRLNSEAEKFKRMGDAAKSEVMRAMAEIEQTKTRIKTAEIRLIAAQKMKEAARATEAVALAEINALEKSGIASSFPGQNSVGVTLTYEEYSSLTSKARDADENAKIKIAASMAQVDGAKSSKKDILARVEQVMEEVETSKKALEEALGRVDAANTAKLAVEEALRKWRSEHGSHKRRSVHNSTKFKNSCASHHRKEPQTFDVDGIIMTVDTTAPVLKPTLSIGQILSRKLLVADEYDGGRKSSAKRKKISLGQMLGRQNGYVASAWKIERQNSNTKRLPAKRKKFGFARFLLLPAMQNKKKKKSATSVARW
ncbi:hypothetical protein Drorol1_Dr00008995 [Drosera rotundifolia]